MNASPLPVILTGNVSRMQTKNLLRRAGPWVQPLSLPEEINAEDASPLGTAGPRRAQNMALVL